MNPNSNSSSPVDFPQLAHLVAGRTVAAVVLGIKVKNLSVAETRPGEWEITLKFDPKCREATIEEFAIIEICGRWAESTVTFRRQTTATNPTTHRANPPGWLDKRFVEGKAEFIATNYYEAIKQIAERLEERRFVSAADIREAIHDGPAIAHHVH